jgi:hypothetical protein
MYSIPPAMEKRTHRKKGKRRASVLKRFRAAAKTFATSITSLFSYCYRRLDQAAPLAGGGSRVSIGIFIFRSGLTLRFLVPLSERAGNTCVSHFGTHVAQFEIAPYRGFIDFLILRRTLSFHGYA